MDFKKFAQIALKDVRLLLQDRGTLAIIILTPLMLTVVLAAAFSGLGSGGNSGLQNIPVVVVNSDQGATLGPQKVNFGQNVSDALKAVTPLLKVTVLTDPDAAKAQVRQGKASAAVLIPADFSQSLNVLNPSFGDTKINVTVFRDTGSPINADIVTAVVRQIVNGFANVDIALNAANKTSNNPLFLALQSESIAKDMAAQMTNGTAPLTTVSSTPNSASSSEPTSAAVSLLTFFAPAMAVFFLNFATAFGAVSIIEEQDNWTLQRLLIAPTSRMTILAGKLGGTFISGVIQLSVLIVATTLIAPLLGSAAPVWGTNIPGLIVLVLVVVAGSVGMGTLLAGVAKTRQQAGVYVSAVMVVLGLVGGSFFGPGDPGPLSRITVNYWATSAFFKLAQTNDLATVLPNMAALLVIFVVCFGAGVYLFNRRLSV